MNRGISRVYQRELSKNWASQSPRTRIMNNNEESKKIMTFPDSNLQEQVKNQDGQNKGLLFFIYLLLNNHSFHVGLPLSSYQSGIYR
jgi:hypothetical protein